MAAEENHSRISVVKSSEGWRKGALEKDLAGSRCEPPREAAIARCTRTSSGVTPLATIDRLRKIVLPRLMLELADARVFSTASI